MNIKEEERKIQEFGEMLESTASFWKMKMLRLASKVNSLVEKIESDPKEELFDELDKVKSQIAHLNAKGEWEQKQIAKFEEMQKNLQKASENQFKNNLKKKLSKSLIRM